MDERLFVRLAEDVLAGPESSTPPDTLRALPVHRSLARHVAHVLEYREAVPPGAEIVERILPDGATRLVFDLGDVASVVPGPHGTTRPALKVVGPTTRSALIRLRGHVAGLSVTLRTGATEPLLGVPAAEVGDTVVALEDLWGPTARELGDQLACAPDAHARTALVSAALTHRLESAATRCTPVAPASRDTPSDAPATLAAAVARHIAARGGVDSLRTLAARAGVGERRLQQLFSAHVGLSPRAWSRLARLHACLRLLRTRTAPAWAQLAIEAGYCDQSHLVNEFRALCGLTPGAFLARSISRSSKSTAAAGS